MRLGRLRDGTCGKKVSRYKLPVVLEARKGDQHRMNFKQLARWEQLQHLYQAGVDSPGGSLEGTGAMFRIGDFSQLA